MAAEGKEFGNYRAVRLIGEGGFGEVYEAENPLLQRRVAIKILHAGLSGQPDLVRRFLNEARAISSLRHPHIIDVFDAGLSSSHEPYIVMELLAGVSLQKHLGGRRLPLNEALEIVRQTGSALSAAHARGIVHRDLKPENIFLVPDESCALGFSVKVLDFGIAKVNAGENSNLKTQTGQVMGSPGYMSPEQCRDSSDVDWRSDIYSLALILYEMLAGQPPFVSESAMEIVVMQMTAAAPPLAELCPDVPPVVHHAVMQALAKDRGQRPASVATFVDSLFGQVAIPDDEQREGMDLAPRPTTRLDNVPLDRLAKAGTPSTVTTLSHARGETGSRSVADEEVEAAEIPRRRWPILAVGCAAVGIAGALLLVPRTRPDAPPSPPSPPAALVAPPAVANLQVRFELRSTPDGASVIDAKDGSLLGKTPFERVAPKGSGTRDIVVRLANHKDKTVHLPLDRDYATAVVLETDVAPKAPSSSAAVEKRKTTVTGPRPVRPKQDEESEWIVH